MFTLGGARCQEHMCASLSAHRWAYLGGDILITCERSHGRCAAHPLRESLTMRALSVLALALSAALVVSSVAGVSHAAKSCNPDPDPPGCDECLQEPKSLTAYVGCRFRVQVPKIDCPSCNASEKKKLEDEKSRYLKGIQKLEKGAK